MNKKLLAPAVTTQEAFDNCLQQNLCMFCIKNPLYSQLFCGSTPVPDIPEYEIERHPKQQIAFFKRISGENTFDPLDYEILYLPFSWDNWHS